MNHQQLFKFNQYFFPRWFIFHSLKKKTQKRTWKGKNVSLKKKKVYVQIENSKKVSVKEPKNVHKNKKMVWTKWKSTRENNFSIRESKT